MMIDTVCNIVIDITAWLTSPCISCTPAGPSPSAPAGVRSRPRPAASPPGCSPCCPATTKDIFILPNSFSFKQVNV